MRQGEFILATELKGFNQSFLQAAYTQYIHKCTCGPDKTHIRCKGARIPCPCYSHPMHASQLLERWLELKMPCLPIISKCILHVSDS